MSASDQFASDLFGTSEKDQLFDSIAPPPPENYTEHNSSNSQHYIHAQPTYHPKPQYFDSWDGLLQSNHNIPTNSLHSNDIQHNNSFEPKFEPQDWNLPLINQTQSSNISNQTSIQLNTSQPSTNQHIQYQPTNYSSQLQSQQTGSSNPITDGIPCTKCFTPNNPLANFCFKCGYSISNNVPDYNPPKVTTPSPRQQYQFQNTTYEQLEYQKTSNSQYSNRISPKDQISQPQYQNHYGQHSNQNTTESHDYNYPNANYHNNQHPDNFNNNYNNQVNYNNQPHQNSNSNQDYNNLNNSIQDYNNQPNTQDHASSHNPVDETNNSPHPSRFPFKGHALAVFGFGKIITFFPKKQNRFVVIDGQQRMIEKRMPGLVSIHYVFQLLVPSIKDDFELKSGSLLPKTKLKKKDVLNSLTVLIEKSDIHSDPLDISNINLNENSPITNSDSELSDINLMYRILKVLIESDGKIGDGFKDINSILSPGLIQPLSNDPLTQYQTLIQSGNKLGALQHAIQFKLWSHAILLASKLNPKVFHDTINSFCLSGFETTNDSIVDPSSFVPLKILYRLLVSDPKLPVGENLFDVGSWKSVLGIIMANRMPGDQMFISSLGEFLNTNGSIHAAHICYMLSTPKLINGYDNPTTKVVLFGSNHLSHPNTFFRNIDAIRSTELYEYSLTLIDGIGLGACLPHFQVYKLFHASVLADLGFFDIAASYIETIENFIQIYNRGSPYFHIKFLETIKSFSERVSGVRAVKPVNTKESRWLPNVMNVLDLGINKLITNAVGLETSTELDITKTKENIQTTTANPQIQVPIISSIPVAQTNSQPLPLRPESSNAFHRNPSLESYTHQVESLSIVSNHSQSFEYNRNDQSNQQLGYMMNDHNNQKQPYDYKSNEQNNQPTNYNQPTDYNQPPAYNGNDQRNQQVEYRPSEQTNHSVYNGYENSQNNPVQNSYAPSPQINSHAQVNRNLPNKTNPANVSFPNTSNGPQQNNNRSNHTPQTTPQYRSTPQIVQPPTSNTSQQQQVPNQQPQHSSHQPINSRLQPLNPNIAREQSLSRSESANSINQDRISRPPSANSTVSDHYSQKPPLNLGPNQLQTRASWNSSLSSRSNQANQTTKSGITLRKASSTQSVDPTRPSSQLIPEQYRRTNPNNLVQSRPHSQHISSNTSQTQPSRSQQVQKTRGLSSQSPLPGSNYSRPDPSENRTTLSRPGSAAPSDYSRTHNTIPVPKRNTVTPPAQMNQQRRPPSTDFSNVQRNGMHGGHGSYSVESISTNSTGYPANVPNVNLEMNNQSNVPIANVGYMNPPMNDSFTNSNYSANQPTTNNTNPMEVDDLGFGNNSKLSKETNDPKNKPESNINEPKPDETNNKNIESGTNQGSGWIGWLVKSTKKEDSKKPDPIKANLGESMSMVYDKELKTWVNPKTGSVSEQKKELAPPPVFSAPASENGAMSGGMGMYTPDLSVSSFRVGNFRGARSKYVDILQPESTPSQSRPFIVYEPVLDSQSVKILNPKIRGVRGGRSSDDDRKRSYGQGAPPIDI